jgi:hypothetical protein
MANQISIQSFWGSTMFDSASGTVSSLAQADKVWFGAYRYEEDMTKFDYRDGTYVYDCAMYRQLIDESSQLQLKLGESYGWLWGYKIFKSIGATKSDSQGS